jgi:hypothetical protein
MNLRIDVAAGFSDWIRLPLAVTSTFLSFDEYSDSVSRGFRDVTGAGSWSTSDVYEYKIVNPTLGIIEFNPLGYTRTEFGQSLEAKIDYDILDPAIIREDKRAPSAAPYRIDLTLKRIAEVGKTWIRDVAAADDSMFQGLPVTISGVGSNPALIAIDLESGRIVNWASTPAQILVNYRDGAVELVPDSSGMLLMTDGSQIPVAGRNFRFLYKADGDWSVQFLKAYAQYERSNIAALDYKSYYVDGSNPTWIWFSACNGNHSISVDYEWDDNGTIRKVIGETHKTSDILQTGTNWTHIELAHTPTNYVSVTGVSVRARVVWRDGDRWRNVDLDTTLVREKSDN